MIFAKIVHNNGSDQIGIKSLQLRLVSCLYGWSTTLQSKLVQLIAMKCWKMYNSQKINPADFGDPLTFSLECHQHDIKLLVCLNYIYDYILL